MDKSKKYVIIIRHGERADYAGNILKFYKFDPELTEKGKLQAEEVGNKLQIKLIEEYNLHPNSIAIVSSPFGRTLQTSIKIHDAIVNKASAKSDQSHLSVESVENASYKICYDTNKIYINNLLSELIEDSFCGETPKEFLTIYNNSELLQDELNNIKLHFMNELDKLPCFESLDECQKRVEILMSEAVEHFFIKENKDAIILISHGSPINLINTNIKYPGPLGMRKICYCATFIYTYNTIKNEFEFIEKMAPNEFNN
jgi:broad specificity phosphatase PhoE